MLHTTCFALVLLAILAETSALRQWHQQHASAGIQQATTDMDFRSLRWPSK